MGARCSTPFCKNLYDFWGDSLYRTLTAGGEDTLLNLASAEYAKRYALGNPPVRWIDVTSARRTETRWWRRGLCQDGPGEMVRFLAERQVKIPPKCGFYRDGVSV